MVDPSKYVVLDVETNGLKAERDDLLSISIYKPDDERTYNRFLPLEKQSFIREEAFAVHHISEKDLRGKQPLTQDEILSLLVDFELAERTILSFGGKGFDKRFLLQYCREHNLYGLENLNFFDFKTMVHSSGNQYYPASKDNLCLAFGIENVSTIHASENDCRLEWELFRRMDNSHLLVTDQNVFKLTPEYIFPASYIDQYSGLRAYAGIPKRYVSKEPVFELRLSLSQTESLHKFPNNFTGNAIEHLISTLLNTTNKKEEALAFLLKNKSKLEYVGSFEGSATLVHTEKRDDGTVALASEIYESAIKALRKAGKSNALIAVLETARTSGGFNAALTASPQAMEQYERLFASKSLSSVALELAKLRLQSMLTDAISEVNLSLKEPIRPLIRKLSQILGANIVSQELVVNESDNCLALCDLSSRNAVIEIKTGWNGGEANKFANQLYYSSADRDCYLLHIQWGSFVRPLLRDDHYDGCTQEEADAHESAITKFILEKISFSTEAPKRKFLRKRPRIKHAVMDWRQLNPDVDDWKACVFDLKLQPNDVEKIWDKCDPKSFPLVAPKKGASLRVFQQIQNWRNAHPDGTRLELSEQIASQLPTIEKWWYLASPEKQDENSIAEPVFSIQSIKNQVSDLADESNIYPLLTLEDISRMREEAEQKGRACGLPYVSSWALPYCLPCWYELEDESRIIQCAKALKSYIDACEERTGQGYIALRIPLEQTSYKTPEMYYPFRPSAVRIKYDKNEVTIYVSRRKVVILTPRFGDLFKFVMEHIDKPVDKAFIERSHLTDKSDFVLVYKD